MENDFSSAALKDSHRQALEQLYRQFRQSEVSTRGIGTFLSQITQITDNTLAYLWQASALPAHVALVAVGGYGRAELFPYSDVDVLILLPTEANLEQDETTRSAIETFIGRCWDIGLHVGSSVRTIEECLKEAANDITVQTAQLEARQITGDTTLYQAYRKQFTRQMNVRVFIQGKLSEMRKLHQKYQDTPYALEPNCKESPGGLRDLHVILWITKAAGLGQNWAELAKNGLATEREERQIKQHEAWLKLVRATLHLLAQRHEDRLVFDMQEQLAAALGYKGDGVRRASEVLMRRYYRTAKAIAQLNQILILSITERMLSKHAAPPTPLNSDFQLYNGTLDIVDDDIYLKNPRQILRTFWVYVQNPGIQTLSARTFRALYNARGLMNVSFRKDPENARTFMEILKAPQGITHAFRLMNQTSVLGRYLWVFRKIVGQMQHDLFHVYTVDQHILMVLRNIRRFFLPEHAHEYPLCSEIAASLDKPWLLYIAALFHDIAKGRGGDHSLLGAEEARRFARAHHINEQDTRFIEFLVAEHLTMSRIAQKEDLGDPDVIQGFVQTIKDERHLNALYLLTVADIRGTSPKVWNSWKGRLIETLYQISLRVLGGHIPSPDALVATRKRAALDILRAHGFHGGDEQALWSTLGVSYFMRHDASEIAWHTENLWNRVTSPQPVVCVRSGKHNDGFQVLVYAADQPDLFARICGYFSFSELSIADARIHTTTPAAQGPGWALDTFQLLPTIDMDDPCISLAQMEKTISCELAALLQKNLPLAQSRPSQRISRRARYFPLPPLIELIPDENQQRWLLSIIAGDRIGLLYAIAKVLADNHVNVEIAKILTLGDRIEDTFLISGEKLGHPVFQAKLEEELTRAIQV